MNRSMRNFVWVGLLAMPLAAMAHVLFKTPTARSSATGTLGPCSGAAYTNNPTTLTAGATMAVVWLETVDHPNTDFRVSYSANPTTMVPDVALTGWLAHDAGLTRLPDGGRQYTAMVTIPTTGCSGCSLQVTQDGGGGTFYYTCADVSWGTSGTDAGGDAGPPGCSPTNCLGCCDSSDTCHVGTADSNCGSGGAACTACTSPAVCGVSGTGGQCFGGATDSGPTPDAGGSGGGPDASTGGDTGSGSTAGGGCNSASSPLATSVLALAGALTLALLARRRRAPAKR